MMKLDIQMFAVPFRKVSKTRKRMRRSHNAMEIPGMTKCPKCGELLTEKSNKRFKGLVCSNKECGYRKDNPQTCAINRGENWREKA